MRSAIYDFDQGHTEASRAGWLAGWLAGSTIQLNHAWMDAIAYFAVTWMHM